MIIPEVGIGTDVHAYDTDRPCFVAGLEWADTPGLAGHSDGDVACHAACNALFSASGLGDLGGNFGTDRPEWANASGLVLLRETATRVRAVGYSIGNVSIQLVGKYPRLSGRRSEAERVLTECLGATVRLSAATTDGLGFTGRGEGLAGTAVALVYRG